MRGLFVGERHGTGISQVTLAYSSTPFVIMEWVGHDTGYVLESWLDNCLAG